MIIATNLRCPVLSLLDTGVVPTQLVDDLWYPGTGHAVHPDGGQEAVGHLGQGPDRVVRHSDQPRQTT